MSTLETCPRCKRQSVKEFDVPPRTEIRVEGKKLTVVPHEEGDRREHHCNNRECGWRSSAVYHRRGIPPGFTQEQWKGQGFWEWSVPSLNSDRKKGLTKM